MSELKHCPFCCGKAEMERADHIGFREEYTRGWKVICRKCSCQTGIEEAETVMNKWNKRDGESK